MVPDVSARFVGEAYVQAKEGEDMTEAKKTVELDAHVRNDEEPQGHVHYLEYYDGPLLGAQMRIAHEDTPIIELQVDSRVAWTDGSTVYARLSRQDLLMMLRILGDAPEAEPRACGAWRGERDCPVCVQDFLDVTPEQLEGLRNYVEYYDKPGWETHKWPGSIAQAIKALLKMAGYG